MSNSEDPQTGELQRHIDDLALQVVMGESLSAPEALRALSEALARIKGEAGQAGWEDVARTAARLEEPVAGAAAGVEEDLTRLEEVLNEGIAELQRAAANRAAEPAPSGQETPAREAAPGQADNALVRDLDLLNDVILESRDHLSSIEARLLRLEQNPADSEAIHSTFRSFHTIKGLAGFLELTAIQEVAHEVESVLDLARNAKLRITPAIIDVVLESKDYLNQCMSRLDSLARGGTAEPEPANSGLLERIRQVAAGEPAGAGSAAAPATGPAAESEPSPAPDRERAEAAAEPQERAATPSSRMESESRAVKVDTSKLDYLVDMAGEMVIAQSMVRHDPDLASLRSQRLQRNLSQLAHITAELQKTAMAMRMVPVEQSFRRMVRLVRDLSRKAGKQVRVELFGQETELDRTIVEQLADPLVHMIRNAVDHGIEPPDVRIAAGKDPAGKVILRAYHQAGQIVIEISDDGKGLDSAKILAKARQKGLVDEKTHLSETDVFNLIFEPGFSTAERVTDVSGRGVGMDVVRKEIQKLRGRIEIQSQYGRGSTFFLRLPLTLAIIDGLVVGVGRERYIVPMFAVKEIFRPSREMVSSVHGKSEMVLVRGSLLPVIRLHRRFGVPCRSEDPTECVFIVAENQGRSFCLMVDEFTGKQEVVIKSLGGILKNVPGIAGGAILGDGRVGLVLDINAIFERDANA